ncbi:hypothetical protein X975_04452, partial [Stegodyphus mimosarum]
MFVEYPIVALEKIIFSERLKKLEEAPLNQSPVFRDNGKDIFNIQIFTLMGSNVAETKCQNAVVVKSFTATE